MGHDLKDWLGWIGLKRYGMVWMGYGFDWGWWGSWDHYCRSDRNLLDPGHYPPTVGSIQRGFDQYHQERCFPNGASWMGQWLWWRFGLGSGLGLELQALLFHLLLLLLRMPPPPF